MRNLIAFITKYSFFFLFLIFEVAAFYLLFKNNHFQRASFLNSTNAISASLYEEYSEYKDYIHLKEVNNSLSKENSQLRDFQIESFERLFGKNIMVNDTIYRRKYLYTKAKVVNNSVTRQNNYLTLNVGRLSGIESGMGVVGPQGVVGIIKNVSDNFSTVVSVLHRESKISVKHQPTQYFGSLQWNGENYLKASLVDIANHVQIKKGDTVVTSGFSSTFPEGIKCAIIEDFSLPEGENFYEIKVGLLNDFKRLTYVYIVKNNYSTEQVKIEKATIESDD